MTPQLTELLAEVAKVKFSKHSLHRIACNHASHKRMHSCGKYPSVKGASIRAGTGLAIDVKGTYSCKHFQQCPKCHDLWINANRLKLRALTGGWPGDVAMATLTIGHSKADTLGKTITCLKKVRTLFLRTKALSSIQSITNIEVKVNLSGWHPHLHCLLFSKSKFSESILQDIELAWRQSAKKEGVKASLCAAKITNLPKSDRQKSADYCFKANFPGSPFDLLKCIELADDEISRNEAKLLWREYVRQIADVSRLRFVSACGKHVKTFWSSYSASAVTRNAANERASLIHDEWSEIMLDPYATDPFMLSQPIAPLVGEDLAEAREIENALAVIDEELSFNECADLYDQDLLDQRAMLFESLHRLISKDRATSVELALLTPIGIKSLSPEDKSFINKARSLRDVRKVLEEAASRHGGPNVEYTKYFTIRYGALEINSMLFEPRDLL